MIWLFVAAALAAAPELESAQVLIGGGGSAPGDAQAYLDKLNRARAEDALSKLVSFAPGYPKTIESTSVPGLKAGLHVVVLGFCGAGIGDEPLMLLRLIDPHIYARATSHVPEKSCPELALAAAKGSPRLGPLEAVQIKDAAWGTVAVLLRTKEGRILQAWRPPPVGREQRGPFGPSEPQCSAGTRSGKSTLFIEQSCRRQTMGGGAYCSVTATASFEVAVSPDGTKLQVKKAPTEEGQTECGGE
jgi:hypothetical protein